MRKAIAALASVGVLVAVAPAAAAPQAGTTIKIGKKVTLLDSGIPISYIGVPVKITCPAAQAPTQFNVGVTQAGTVTGSFGYVIAQCTGAAEKFAVAVQSNYGSLYLEGLATATVSDGVTTAVKDVQMKRLA